jgi:hypothetical protein
VKEIDPIEQFNLNGGLRQWLTSNVNGSPQNGA